MWLSGLASFMSRFCHKSFEGKRNTGVSGVWGVSRVDRIHALVATLARRMTKLNWQTSPDKHDTCAFAERLKLNIRV